jgi:hypothetical protein
MQNMLEINRRHAKMKCTETQYIEINDKMKILIQESYLVHMSLPEKAITY